MAPSATSSSLPAEIYANILEYCPLEPTLLRVARCCKAFHQLSIREIYRNVELYGTRHLLQFCGTINGSDSKGSNHDHGRYVRCLLISQREDESDDWLSFSHEAQTMILGNSDRAGREDALLADKVSQMRAMALTSLTSAIFRMPNLKRFAFQDSFIPSSPDLFCALATKPRLLKLSANPSHKFVLDWAYDSRSRLQLDDDFANSFFGLIKDQATTLSKLSISCQHLWSGNSAADVGRLFCGSSNSLPAVLPALRELELVACSISWIPSGPRTNDDTDLVRDMGPFLALNPQLKVLKMTSSRDSWSEQPEFGYFPITRNPSILPNGGNGLPQPPFIWPEFESLDVSLEQLIQLMETPQPELRRIVQGQEQLSFETNEWWSIFFNSLVKRYRKGPNLGTRSVTRITEATLRPHCDVVCKSWIEEAVTSLEGIQNLTILPILDHDPGLPQTVESYTQLLKPLSTVSSLVDLTVWYPSGPFDKSVDTLKEAISQMIPSIPSSQNVKLSW